MGDGKKVRTSLRGRLPAALVGTALLVAAGGAAAQDAVSDSVLGRPRPGYDPMGIDLFAGPNDPGSPFILYPSLGISGGWDDNVFRENTDTDSDFFVLLTPSLVLASDWVNHGMTLSATAGIERNVNYSENNFTVFDIGLSGFVDVGLDSQVFLGTSFGRAIIGPDDIDSPDFDEITKRWYNTQTLGFSTAFGDFTWGVEGNRRHYNYVDNSENQQDRDRTEYEIGSRLGYEFQPGVTAFVEGGYNWRTYEDPVDDNGYERDSHGWEVRGGIFYDITGVLAAELSAGYISQSYADPRFGTNSGFAIDSEITWNPTDLITIRGVAGTSISETILDGYSSARVIYGGIGFDYDLAENLIFTSDATYLAAHYDPATGFDKRDDDVVTGEIGLIYLINEYFQLKGGYAHTRRYSTAPGEDYTDNTIILTLQSQI